MNWICQPTTAPTAALEWERRTSIRLVDDKKPERLQNKHLIHDSETNRRRATRHGFYYEPWYSSYKSMMERCYHPKCRQYEQYGGRGIKICEEWHNINAFAEWVKTSGYEKGLSIDRINVNGDYCPENCRWATSKEQANNRRNNVFYEYKGESHTLAEWARITGINRYTLWSRINKQGWTIEMALSDRQDAVPVVRCQECRYYPTAKVNEKGFLICPASGMEITETDYCSYGERMDKEDET